MNFANTFSAFIEMILWFSLFILVIWWFILIDFQMFHLRSTPHSYDIISFLYITGFGLPKFCYEFLHLCSWTMLVYSFFIISLSGFGIQVLLSSQKELGTIPSSAFWKFCKVLWFFWMLTMFYLSNSWEGNLNGHTISFPEMFICYVMRAREWKIFASFASCLCPHIVITYLLLNLA